jgi:hypothetical protein
VLPHQRFTWLIFCGNHIDKGGTFYSINLDISRFGSIAGEKSGLNFAHE